MINDIKIYKRYLETKEKKGRVGDLLGEFNISRGTLYDAIRRIQVGDTKALRRCLTLGKFECTWEYKYKARFLSLPKDRSATTIKELHKIIHLMKADGFQVTMIARKLGRERSTIIHYLNKK